MNINQYTDLCVKLLHYMQNLNDIFLFFHSHFDMSRRTRSVLLNISKIISGRIEAISRWIAPLYLPQIFT